MSRRIAWFFGLTSLTLSFSSNAAAQVVIQSEAQSGGVYGQGTVYVGPQPQAEAQPQSQPVIVQSPYVGAPQAEARPAQTIVRRSPTNALLVPGIIAFGAGWLVHGFGSLGILEQCQGWSAGSSCPAPVDSWAGLGWIPIVGPWLAYGLTDYVGDYAWFNILFGVVQDVGAILMVLGLSIQQEWEEIYADLGDGVRLGLSVGPTSIGANLTF